MPAAVAAGVMALGGVFTLLRGPVSPFPAWESGLAAGASSPALEPSLLGPGEPRALVANGQLIRDARLDRYLEAHQQFAGSSALGVPSGFLRSATVVSGVER
jgi:sigma-E factor negative regulatory protein RseA